MKGYQSFLPLRQLPIKIYGSPVKTKQYIFSRDLKLGSQTYWHSIFIKALAQKKIICAGQFEKYTAYLVQQYSKVHMICDHQQNCTLLGFNLRKTAQRKRTQVTRAEGDSSSPAAQIFWGSTGYVLQLFMAFIHLFAIKLHLIKTLSFFTYQCR